MTLFNTLYSSLAGIMQRYGGLSLRIALAIIFIWFGGLKLHGMSPAAPLITTAITWFEPEIFIPVLGVWEVMIGAAFLFRRTVPLAVLLILPHMAGTMLPLIVAPQLCFDAFPYCPTMEGQYIMKNLVLISGAMVIGGNSSKSNS